MNTIANPDPARLNLHGGQSRSTLALPLSIHAYLPAAAFYFFFNGVGLPQGLFYSTLLSPLLFLWLYLKGRHWLTARFLLFLSPFFLAHLIIGIVSPLYYLRSLFLLWTTYITVYAFAWALLRCRRLARLFDELITLNLCFAMFAAIGFFTPLQSFLWHDDSNSVAGASHLLRLKLLVSEPSVYANLMLPLLIFAALRLLRESTMRNILFLIMVAFPFLLCQSFGGLSMCLAGLGISVMTSYRRFLKRPKNLAILACLVIAIGALLATHNPIADRVMQVLTGGDSSTKSRTIFSFIVAYTVASGKSLWWGVGLGQAKLFDVSDLGIGFTTGVIPNAVAGTFAELGLFGVAARFAAELYLFFKTRVYLNSFRLAMFVIAFITQLTGSHLMDVQQYLMWCFAFFTFFPEMNLRGDSTAGASRLQNQAI